DARDDVEGNQALGAGGITIHGKGNAHAPEDQVGFFALGRQRLRVLRIQPCSDVTVMRPYLAVGIKHFVEEIRHGNQVMTRTFKESISMAVMDSSLAS